MSPKTLIHRDQTFNNGLVLKIRDFGTVIDKSTKEVLRG
jgi:hypothetical protein